MGVKKGGGLTGRERLLSPGLWSLLAGGDVLHQDLHARAADDLIEMDQVRVHDHFDNPRAVGDDAAAAIVWHQEVVFALPATAAAKQDAQDVIRASFEVPGEFAHGVVDPYG